MSRAATENPEKASVFEMTLYWCTVTTLSSTPGMDAGGVNFPSMNNLSTRETREWRN